MKRLEFENKFLNKNVEITFFDGEIVKGKLEKSSTKDYSRIPKANYYSVDGGLWFRKSHVKKIERIKNV